MAIEMSKALIMGKEYDLTDAAVSGDVDALKSAINTTTEFLYDFAEKTIAQTAAGWRLNENDGLCTSAEGYKLIKYTVVAGDLIKVVSDDRFQFQTVASVPASGTSNRVGNTYGVGEYLLTVPKNATYLIMSSRTNGNAKAYGKTTDIIDSLGSVVGAVFPKFEKGDLYVNGSGTGTYYSSDNRLRTPQGTTISLKTGDTLKLKTTSGYQFLVYAKTGTKTYTCPTTWTSSPFTITSDIDAVILLRYSPESTISNISDLTDNFEVWRANGDHLKLESVESDVESLDNNVESLGNEVESLENNVESLKEREKAIDYFRGAPFELGDLYVNSSGVGTYYDSTSRMRTLRDNPIALKRGTVVGLSDYTNGVYGVRKKISEGQYKDIGGSSWKTADCLISEDGEYEFLLKYPTEATITDATAFAALFRIKDPSGIVREITNVQNLTDVYKDELNTTIATVREKTTSRGLVFGIITDTHLDDKRVTYYDQTMENLERLNNGLQFNAICHLGDIINGYDSAIVAKAQMQYAMQRLKKIAGNTFVAVGNHDNNNGAGDAERLNDAVLYSYIERFNEHYVIRSMTLTDSVYENAGSNYYVDYAGLKIRAIFFDSCYYGGGFPDDMLPWLRTVLRDAPSDYHFVLFTHMSTESVYNGGSALGNASAMKSLLAEYKDRIYCYIHGHTHYDAVYYTNEFVQIGLCCAVPDQSPSSVPDGAISPTRTIGTVTQDCISVIIILPDEGKVELVRFGAGDDAAIPFREA